MAKVISNKKLNNESYYLLTVQLKNNAKMGQFYMLRKWDNDPILSRPFSVFDRDENHVTFLYKVVGKGTNILSTLKPGDDITCYGPYGNTFPQVKGRIALVAGGVGIAPLYIAAKTLRNEDTKVDIYYSLRGKEILRKELSEVSDYLLLRTNERVVKDVDASKYDYIFTCGPESLMIDLYRKAKEAGTVLYASLERRMACGIGVCYSCTCRTSHGNKLTCKDGPIFLGREIFGNE